MLLKVLLESSTAAVELLPLIDSFDSQLPGVTKGFICQMSVLGGGVEVGGSLSWTGVEGSGVDVRVEARNLFLSLRRALL